VSVERLGELSAVKALSRLEITGFCCFAVGLACL